MMEEDGFSFSSASPSEIFELVDLLGEGSYGAVYRAHYKADPSLPPVAIKIIPADEDLSGLKREIAILNRCRSAYVVDFKDCFFVDGEVWIVMEFCMGGSVADMLDATQRTLAEPQIRAICACATMGLAYLHGKNNIHRDVKAGNILLSLDGKAKLADFGVSASLNNTMSKRKTVIGTPFWMAPEVIQEICYDGKADVWSLGITAIEMAEGMPPHFNIHPMRAIFMIPSKPSPKLATPAKWSPEFHSFLACCLDKDPAKRLDAQALLSHPFLRENVAALQAGPEKGLAPIKELVTSALEVLAKYRESTTTSAANVVPLEDQFAKTGALDDDDEVAGGGGGGGEEGEEDGLVRQEKATMRPISLSVSGAGGIHSTATTATDGDYSSPSSATLLRPPPSARGLGCSHSGAGQHPSPHTHTHHHHHHDEEEGNQGGAPLQDAGQYGTLVRTSATRKSAASAASMGGGELSLSPSNTYRRGAFSPSASISTSGCAAASASSSMDVSQTGTMVRHRPISVRKSVAGGGDGGRRTGGGGGGEIGSSTTISTTISTSTSNSSATEDATSTLKKTGSARGGKVGGAGGQEANPGLQSALRYFQNLALGSGGGSGGGKVDQMVGVEEEDMPLTSGMRGGGGETTAATAAAEGGDVRRVGAGAGAGLPPASAYHDQKLAALKASTAVELREMLEALQGQFESDASALEESYLTQKKHLEEALQQQQQQQQSTATKR